MGDFALRKSNLLAWPSSPPRPQSDSPDVLWLEVQDLPQALPEVTGSEALRLPSDWQRAMKES